MMAYTDSTDRHKQYRRMCFRSAVCYCTSEQLQLSPWWQVKECRHLMLSHTLLPFLNAFSYVRASPLSETGYSSLRLSGYTLTTTWHSRSSTIQQKYEEMWYNMHTCIKTCTVKLSSLPPAISAQLQSKSPFHTAPHDRCLPRESLETGRKKTAGSPHPTWHYSLPAIYTITSLGDQLMGLYIIYRHIVYITCSRLCTS